MTDPTPWHTQNEFTLHKGDCLEHLKRIPDESVDTFAVDGPYGIHFMGKAWDGQRIAAQHEQNQLNGGHDGRGAKEAGRYKLTPKAMAAFQEFTYLWACEAFRILKPGGHLVSFCSTRTYHRMAVGIEDAGFEIRDQLAWAYGTGFPKSLDVSKAIDASDKIGTVRMRSLRFTEFMRTTGLTSRQINEATNSLMASHYLTAKEQPEVATEDMFSKLRPLIAARGVVIPGDIEELVTWRTVESENMKRRRVIRTETMVDLKKSRPVSLAAQGLDSAGKREVNITAAHTEDAKEWEGWGTALKPSWEPIALARKPLEGTVADNVLKFGTGGLNIGGCRIPSERTTGWAGAGAGAGGNTWNDGNMGLGKDGEPRPVDGRWPANIVHDGSEEVVAMFPSEDAEGNPISAARFFKSAGNDEIDLLFCNAKTLLAAWNPSLANIAENSFPQSEEVVVSVLNLAAIAASRGVTALSTWRGPSTPVTLAQLKRIAETLIAAILWLEKKPWPNQWRDVPTLSGSVVSHAEANGQTGTTTITINLPKSDGSAGAVMFAITLHNLALGERGCERFSYSAKTDGRDREEGLEELALKTFARSNGAQSAEEQGDDYGAAGDVGMNKVSKRRNIHPTVKPTELMRWLLRLVTPKGGKVVDCFTGSGSTGKACMLEGYHFTGIDLDEEGEYLPIAKLRILYALEHKDRWEQIHAAPPPPDDLPGQLVIAL